MASNLDPDIKAKWLAALRSGDYQQARAMLRHPATGAMCCIGVLGAIQGEPLECMDRRLLCSLEHAHRHGGISIGDLADLANKNDAGWTFTEIADYIAMRF